MITQDEVEANALGSFFSTMTAQKTSFFAINNGQALSKIKLMPSTQEMNESFHFFDIKVPLLMRAKENYFCRFCGHAIRVGTYFFLYPPMGKKNDVASYCLNCRVCRDGHIMSYCSNLTNFREELYLNNKYYCDVCATTMRVKSRVLRCPGCMYDVCPDCEEKHFSFDSSLLKSDELLN